MQVSLKKLSCALIAALMLVSLAACGGGTGGTSTSTPPAGDGSTSTAAPSEGGGEAGGEGSVIRVLNWGRTQDETVYNAAVDRWLAANPGYTVDQSFVTIDGWANYIQKWITMNAGNDKPDVINIAIEGAKMAIYNDLTLPLNDLIAADPDMQAYLDATPEVQRTPFMDGDVYHGLTNGGQSCYLWYNKDVFDAAGVDYPKNGITWDEFYELCGQMTSGEGEDKIFGYLIPTVTSCYWTSPWFFSNGSDIVSEDWTTPTFTDPGIIEAVEYVASIKDAGYSPDPVGADGVSMFANGKIAMYAYGRHSVWEWHNMGFDNFDCVPMPQKVKQQTVYGGAYWCISKSAADPEACFSLVKEMLSNETLGAISKEGQQIPPTKELATDPAIMGEFISQETIDLMWDVMTTARPVASPYFYSALEPAYQRAFESVLAGSMSAEDAMAQAQSEVEAAIASM